MIRRKEERKVDVKKMFNGDGEVILTHILNGADEMYGKGRMFNVLTLAPGNTIGRHTHEGDNEIFYFLSGTGEYDDNGTITTVGPGDVAICSDGQAHCVKNTGDIPLEFIALILYS